MATSKSIRVHLDGLYEAVLEAQYFSRVCDDLVFGQAEQPAWVYCIAQQVERVRVHAECLETVLRQQALPMLEDLEGGAS